MWNLRNNINESIYKKQTQRHRKETYGYQRGKSGEEEIKSMGLTKLLYTE